MLKYFSSLSIAILLFSADLWARAGGSGGGHSVGGGSSFGGGGFGGSHSYGGGGYIGNGSGNGFFTFLCFIIVIIVVVRALKKRGRGETQDPINNLFNTGEEEDQIEAQERKVKMLSMDPAQQGLIAPAELPLFERKVITAFGTIQEAWSQKRLPLMRRFISDGVYQRFNAQFTMMNMLGQTDVMQNVAVHKLAILKAVYSGIYEVIDVAVEAYAEDQFVSDKYPDLNSPGGGEKFIEVWSFIRRRDHQKGKDIYHSEMCPKCSAPLNEKLLETARCQYCGAYLNNGEFDWVLSEITQIDDYKTTYFHGKNDLHKSGDIQKVQALFPEFSATTVEDRATNAFMQILIATARKDLKPLKKFSTGAALDTFASHISDSNYIYDRLFVNATDLIGLSITDNMVRAVVGIRYSFRRIKISGNQIELLDNEVRADSRYLVLVRQAGGPTSKGSIFANACPSCGAAQKDSLSVSCEYCGAVMNDPKLDWVIEGLKTFTV